jgi:hypothetical protein
MMDNVEPHEGWNFGEVSETKHSSATNDMYGKLFKHIGSILSSFKHRLSDVGANFELRNLDAAELPRVLTPGSFARIEVHSNPTQQFSRFSLTCTRLPISPMLPI